MNPHALALEENGHQKTRENAQFKVQMLTSQFKNAPVKNFALL